MELCFAHYAPCAQVLARLRTLQVTVSITHTFITIFCATNLVPVHDPLSLAIECVFANGPVTFGTNTRCTSEVKSLRLGANNV